MKWSGALRVSCASVLAGALVLLSDGNRFGFDAAGQRTLDPLPAPRSLDPALGSPQDSTIASSSVRSGVGHPDAQVRRAALQTLALAANSTGPDATSLLVDAALGHSDVAVREEAVLALGERGDELVVPTLQQALQDSQARVRVAGLRALSEVGTEEAVLVLGGALSAADASLRVDAADALGEIGTRDTARFLQLILGDVDPRVRESAEEWLEELDSAHGR